MWIKLLIKLKKELKINYMKLYKCHMCSGKGITDYIDISDERIPYGRHDFNELLNKYGKSSICPTCKGIGHTIINGKSLKDISSSIRELIQEIELN